MAKSVRKATGARTARRNPPVTLDERDAAIAREGGADPSRTSAIESGQQTAKERREARAEQRDYAEEKAEQNRRDLAESDPVGAEEEGDMLPITHATLPDRRDVGPPPEANPREGKSSMPPPVQAGPSQDDLRRRTARRVLVEATRLGYYDLIRRQAGDRFFINDPADFSKRWMRKAPADAGERVSTPNQRIRQQHDEILANKFGGQRTGPSSGIEASETSDNPLED